MSFDVTSDFNLAGGLPKGAAMQALDAEIANEGERVLEGDKIILSNGEMVAYTPPPPKLVIPDLSEVKSLRHYFGRTGHQVYPAWLYHRDGHSILAKNAADAAKVGVVYRKATRDEQNRYGLQHLWDWEAGSDWRPSPWEEPKFDPRHPGSGKDVVWKAPDPKIAQHALVAELIPAVAAAVAQSLKANGPAAPANVDPAQWQQFLEFQAWQKSQDVVQGAAAAIIADSALGDARPADDVTEADPLANALSPEQDRLLWEEEAKRLNVKIDKRWSLETLRAKVEEAASAAL